MRPIALMLLDFQMPKKTGLQVVDELKKFYAATNMELEIKGSAK
jgi:CheY-like chemotaxis protein